MTIDGLPHTSSEAYITQVLELAEALSYPALAVASERIGAGRNGWGAWVAAADRQQLVQALATLVARSHREAKA